MARAFDGFSPIPSRDLLRTARVTVQSQAPAGATAGIVVGRSGTVAPQLELDRAALAAAGFAGEVGQALGC